MRFGRWARWGWTLVLLGLIAGAQAGEVKGVRVWSGPDSTRIVLDLTAPA